MVAHWFRTRRTYKVTSIGFVVGSASFCQQASWRRSGTVFLAISSKAVQLIRVFKSTLHTMY